MAAVATVIYPISDREAAVPLYTALLGVEPFANEAYYVGFQVGDVQVGLDPTGAKQGLVGPLPYVAVDDVKATIEALTAAGATVTSEPTDVGGGMLMARLVDADGNAIGLTQGAPRAS